MEYIENLDWNQITNSHFMEFGVIAFIILIIYSISSLWIKKSNFNIDHKRRLTSNARGLFTFILVMTALLIWSNEIYSVMLSLAAIGAALAIATKEFLLCVGGGFYKTVARPFTIGDRIEVDGVRGDVIEFGFISTQLMEVGPGDLTHQYTGRSVNIPNSRFLDTNIINESFSTEYVLHVFKVPIQKDSNWEMHHKELLEAANLECNQYIERGERHFKKIANKRQVDIPSIHPRVNIKVIDTNTINLVVRVTIPSTLRGKIEQKIIKEYLNKVL
jgi:small-conductance mechanosensitive channel